jgi:hypothetical protein
LGDFYVSAIRCILSELYGFHKCTGKSCGHVPCAFGVVHRKKFLGFSALAFGISSSQVPFEIRLRWKTTIFYDLSHKKIMVATTGALLGKRQFEKGLLSSPSIRLR